MRKIITSFASGLKGLLALVAVCCLGSFSANAEVTNLGELKLDTTYDLPSGKGVEATFTAPATGSVKCIGSNPGWYLSTDYSDANIIQGEFSGYGSTPTFYTYKVTEGVTYYLYNPYWDFNNSTMRLEMEDGSLSLTKVNPETGSVLAPVGYGCVDIYFNTKFTLSGVKLVSGANSKTLVGRLNGNSLQIEYAAPLLEWLKSGAVKGGDAVQIVVSGLKTPAGVMYNQTGELVLDYVASDMPVLLVDKKLPDPFKSYFVPGSADAVATFTFSDKLAPAAENGTANLMFGTAEGEDGEFYLEEVPFTVEGATISMDFSGKRRHYTDMVLSGTNYGNLTLRLNGIKDAKGVYAASEGLGTIGSYDFVLNYAPINKANVRCEFTPANGESLNGVNEIEVWIGDAHMIKFDGFNIAYSDNSVEKNVEVPMSAVTVKSQSATEAEYAFAVPAEVKGKSNIVVSLLNPVSLDGYDHSEDVKSVYDSFVITYIEPANGASIAGLFKEDVVTIMTNYTERYPEMYIVWEIEDLNPVNPDEAIVKSQSWLNRQEDGTYTSEILSNIKMESGHRYRARFTAWENEMAKNYQNPSIGEAFVYWDGTSAPFKYSAIKFVGITPDPNASGLSTSQNKFVVEFDGMVRLTPEHVFINTGMGYSTPFESINAIGDPYYSELDGQTYDNKWELVVSESYMKSLDSNLVLSVQAFDEDNLVVQGNTGSEENSYFMFTYDMAAAYRPFNITPADGSELESLYKFTVSAEEGIMPSWNGRAYLMTMQGGEVCGLTVKTPDLVYDENGNPVDENNTELEITLDEEVTTPGAYLLYFPAGYFVLGVQFESWLSEETFARYTVASGETPSDKVTITPAPGNVEKLTTISVVYDEYDEIGIGSGAITLSKDGEVLQKVDAELDWDIYNKAVINFNSALTSEDGEYVVDIPAGYFALGSTGEGSSAAMKLVYNVGKGSSVPTEEIMVFLVNEDGEPLYDTTVDSFSMLAAMTMNEAGFKRSDIPAEEAIVVSMFQETVAHVTNVTLNEWDGVAYDCYLELSDNVDQEGQYMVVIPEGYFVMGNGAKSAEFKMPVTVLGQLKAVATPAEGKVKELTEISVKFSANVGQGWATPYLMKDDEDVDVEITVEAEDLEDASKGLTDAYVLKLSAPVTELGNYTLVLPMGSFVNEVGGYLPEFTFDYEVTGEDAPKAYTVIPAEGGVTELSSIDITFVNEASVGNGLGKATLTFQGATVELPDAEYGWEWNEMVQPLGQTYTEMGTYTITFPAGYFALGEYGDRESEKIVLTYTIGQDGIVSIGADENGNYTVYNLNGVQVLVTDNAAELKTLVPGFYIVNNVKVYIK